MPLIMIPTINGNLYVPRSDINKAWTNDIKEAQEFSQEEAGKFVSEILTGELKEAAVIVSQVLAYSSPPWKDR
jgi:hypothetical protein